MANDVYSSVGEAIDKAWIDRYYQDILQEGVSPPGVRFLDPVGDEWGSIAKARSSDDMRAIYDRDKAEILLPPGVEREPLAHETLHYLDDIYVPGSGRLSDKTGDDQSTSLRYQIAMEGLLGVAQGKGKDEVSPGIEKFIRYASPSDEYLTNITQKGTAGIFRSFPKMAARKIAGEAGTTSNYSIQDLVQYVEDREKTLAQYGTLSQEYLSDKGRAEYAFDPSGKDYDYARALELGYKRSDDPSGKGHLPSLDSETGMVLKGRGNKKEWDLMVEEEEKLGNIIVKGSTLMGPKDARSEKYMPDRWYSVTKPEDLSKEDIFRRYPDLFKELYE
jgi:hypothetical protein|tara:strand:- start:138 stop:1133 length:996 start_codon:yes stop_codon:yes gene_type:complete